MKEIKTFSFFFLIALLTWTPVVSQNPNCQNLGFELGDFTNWEGYTWTYSVEHPEVTTLPVAGLLERRQTIITDTEGYDPFTGGELKLIPPGYQYSARLGDAIRTPYSGSARCWNQNLRYTMTIDSANAFLVLKFALVLEFADDHSPVEEPRFQFRLYDEIGDTIPDCANYDVYASNEDIEGFNFYVTPDGQDEIMWRDWTTVGVNLLNYLGQTITIEFMTADCAQTYHMGYAYFVASCQPLNITLRYCTADSVALLTAPEGFERYSWTDSNGTIIDTLQILDITDPVEGAIYSCSMTSATGCEVTLSSKVARYTPIAVYGSSMLDCNSNTVQLTNLSSTNQGILSYLWDFGDGNTSSEKNPRYTFSTSGIHDVSLTLFNPPSSCIAVLNKEVESFSPSLVGIAGDSTYCPDQSVFLSAYGAYEYTWSNGSTEDSIEISHPGGDFWLVGRSSTGCISDTTNRSIGEEPDWEFLAEGDTALCVGESTILITSGADTYLWSTGETSGSIPVSTSGTFISTGKNKRGCEKTSTFNVIESPPPEVEFTLSDYTLDSRHNELTGNIPAQTDVQYEWDMGDGTTQTGSSIQHNYTISGPTLYYTITLEATDKYGCKNSSSEIVDVVPFVPNVFSPNEDGINDVFMPGFQVQIFDRQGLVLYEGTDGWDGRYKGQPANPDTYFYTINYSNREEQEQQIKGYLTLVR